MILKYILGSDRQSQAPSRCLSLLYSYLHRISASMGRAQSRSHKCPVLELLVSQALPSCGLQIWTFSWVSAVIMGQLCERGSTLSMVQFAEHYEKERSRKNYSFHMATRAWTQPKLDPEGRTIYIMRQKQTKKMVSWTISTNTKPSLFNITRMEPPCIDALNS